MHFFGLHQQFIPTVGSVLWISPNSYTKTACKIAVLFAGKRKDQMDVDMIKARKP